MGCQNIPRPGTPGKSFAYTVSGDLLTAIKL
jgi:hypothetical protein